MYFDLIFDDMSYVSRTRLEILRVHHAADQYITKSPSRGGPVHHKSPNFALHMSKSCKECEDELYEGNQGRLMTGLGPSQIISLILKHALQEASSVQIFPFGCLQLKDAVVC